MPRPCLLILMLTALLSCSEESPSNTEIALAETPQAARVAAVLPPELAPLPRPLMNVIERRREHVPRLEVEPIFAATMSEDRLRRALESHQPLIAAALRASEHLEGVLPIKPDFSDEEVRQGLHLAQPQAILLNHARLFRADAVRCWEEGDYDGAAARFAAALRLAEYLLGHEDEHTRLSGSLSFIPVLFDLESIHHAGLLDDAPGAVLETLCNAIHSIDPHRCLFWDDTGRAARARSGLVEALCQQRPAS